MVFHIQPHVRLHEWVAEERGFFHAEGLDYQFDSGGFAAGSATGAMVTSAGAAPAQFRSGAFEDMAQGRDSDVSCACHWAVNAASAEHHGKMYAQAYSICPSAIFVAPDSTYHEPADLAGVDVAVGYHSGSHYSALQGLEPFINREDMALHFGGRPYDRVRLVLQGEVPAANVWGPGYYLLEQRGFRKIVDTTFVMGFLISPEAQREDVDRYFRALLRAQQEIDLQPERYKHYWLQEMPTELQELVDVRRFGPGERIVGQPYTQEMFETTHRWMREGGLLDVAAPSEARYAEAVLS